jgi:hypothetical protein
MQIPESLVYRIVNGCAADPSDIPLADYCTLSQQKPTVNLFGRSIIVSHTEHVKRPDLIEPSRQNKNMGDGEKLIIECGAAAVSPPA